MGSVFYKSVEYFLDKRIVILENKGRREMWLGGKGQAREEDRQSWAGLKEWEKLADSKVLKLAQ